MECWAWWCRGTDRDSRDGILGRRRPVAAWTPATGVQGGATAWIRGADRGPGCHACRSLRLKVQCAVAEWSATAPDLHPRRAVTVRTVTALRGVYPAVQAGRNPSEALSRDRYFTWNSILLFFARPSGVLFGAIGSLSPRPTTVSRPDGMPWLVSQFFTDWARCNESRRLVSGCP
jgi:hypothetical protein